MILEFWSSWPLPPFSMTWITGLVECWGSTLGLISVWSWCPPTPQLCDGQRAQVQKAKELQRADGEWVFAEQILQQKEKDPPLPLPYSHPTREAAASLQREWWQLTRPTLLNIPHYLCRDLLVTFSTSGFFPSSYRFGSSSLIGWTFSPYLHTHTQPPSGHYRTPWIPAYLRL